MFVLISNIFLIVVPNMVLYKMCDIFVLESIKIVMTSMVSNEEYDYNDMYNVVTTQG